MCVTHLLVYLTEQLRLPCTHFPMPFNIILTYTNTSRVNAFRRLLVFKLKGKKINQNITIKINELTDQVKKTKVLGVCKDEQLS